jgi:phosphoenolpyruvate synthase/pyruvate phosphate dikinase
MSTRLVRRLADVRIADIAEVGGKAAGLGELLAVGARVPDGVVLTAEIGDMPADDRRSVVAAVAIDLGSGPFAVRSSGISEDGAERSFAGMYASVLDVPADELPAAVDRCLASARAGRVAAYDAVGDARIAVVIQRMVSPAAAGARDAAEGGLRVRAPR